MYPRVARGARGSVPGAERAEAQYPCLLAIHRSLADQLEQAVDWVHPCGGPSRSRSAC